MNQTHKDKCHLVSVGFDKRDEIVNPIITIDKEMRKIHLDYKIGKVLFNGEELWRKYTLKCITNGVVFGFVNSIGDRSNGWAKVNHYIAIRKKDKRILGLLTREMGWHGSFGQKYSEWKKEILDNAV